MPLPFEGLVTPPRVFGPVFALLASALRAFVPRGFTTRPFTPRPFASGASVRGALALAVLALAAFAPVALADAGIHAFEFVQLPSEPVGRSLGGAHLATVSGPEAIAWNPAGIATETSAFALSHATWAAQTAWEWGAITLPLGRGACALACGFFRSGELEGFTSDGAPTGGFTPTQLVATIGYGLPLGERWGAGLALEGAYESDGVGQTRRAIAVNAGLQLDLGRVALGLAALHLGPPVEADGTRFPLPATFRLGATLLASSALDLHAALEYRAQEPLAMRLGCEWTPLSALHLLAGAGIVPQSEPQTETTLQPAVGTAFDLGHARVAYGLLFDPAVETSHQLSLTVRF
jgi:hypothetical protein